MIINNNIYMYDNMNECMHAGVRKDGQIRHFFHRPSKAYTTGTRKRRKVNTEDEGSETRWHKTGKTRAIMVNGGVKGFKKILVLYTNYGRKRKPEKTSWVMHQYHLGSYEEEKEGELVMSKVFYQTQPRQCASSSSNSSKSRSASLINSYSNKQPLLYPYDNNNNIMKNHPHPQVEVTTMIPNKNNIINGSSSSGVLEYYTTTSAASPPTPTPTPPTSYISNYEHMVAHNPNHSHSHHNINTSVREEDTSPQLIPNLVNLQGDPSSFFSFGNACKQGNPTF